MHYHQGQGVGHLHTADTRTCMPERLPDVEIHSPHSLDCESRRVQIRNANSGSNNSDGELGLGDCNFEGWEDIDPRDSESGDQGDLEEDEDFAGM